MVGCENFFIISIKIQSYFLKLLNPNPSTKDCNHHILGHLPLSKKNGKQGEVKQKTRSSWEKTFSRRSLLHGSFSWKCNWIDNKGNDNCTDNELKTQSREVRRVFHGF